MSLVVIGEISEALKSADLKQFWKFSWAFFSAVNNLNIVAFED